MENIREVYVGGPWDGKTFWGNGRPVELICKIAQEESDEWILETVKYLKGELEQPPVRTKPPRTCRYKPSKLSNIMAFDGWLD